MDEAYPIKRIEIGENTLDSIGKILKELGIKTSVSVISDNKCRRIQLVYIHACEKCCGFM